MWQWLEDKLGITKLKSDNKELERKVQSYKASNKHTLDRVERIYSMVKEPLKCLLIFSISIHKEVPY
ncbi:hypothetical protein VP424E501_P0007 [Vibrio phage 424E50-1]|nr:hypothetical protein VP424E501_P0007 [Vibrio phage 424E50-1]